MPTTRKEAARVRPNSEVVVRDRGWRWEGMEMAGWATPVPVGAMTAAFKSAQS